MIKSRRIIPIIFYIIIGSTACTQIYDAYNKFTVEQLQNDFLKFKEHIEDNHPALYRYYDKTFFNSYFDSVYSLINEEMTELEFIKLLDPVIAKVHCGHTELQYSDNFGNYIYENGLFIPFSINYLKAKAYIVRNYKEDISEYLGSEIISINGISAA